MHENDRVVAAITLAATLLNEMAKEKLITHDHPVFDQLIAARRIVENDATPDLIQAVEYLLDEPGHKGHTATVRRFVRRAKAQQSDSPIKAALRQIGFQSFDEGDWSGYAGVDSGDPLIQHTNNKVMIYDVNTLGEETLYIEYDDASFHTYKLVEAANG